MTIERIIFEQNNLMAPFCPTESDYIIRNSRRDFLAYEDRELKSWL